MVKQIKKVSRKKTPSSAKDGLKKTPSSARKNMEEVSSISEKNNTVIVRCPHCGGKHVVKNGNKYNRQRYLCRNCEKSFCIVDSRIKRDIKERELCLLLYSHNMSLRSIQSILCKFYNFGISFNLILRWIKSFSKLLSYDLDRKKKEKPKTINILELDELYSYFYDLKKNEKNMSKYGLLLIGTDVRLLHLM
jgi:transposase-like protein